MELRGTTVLVTGAAHRIGAAISEVLAAEGCRMVLHYRSSTAAAEQTLKRIRSTGVEAVSLRADLSEAGAPETLLRQAVDLGFSPKILVNSAAAYPRNRWDDTEWQDLETSLKLNSFAPLSLMRSFARLPGAGAVLNLLDARMVDYDSLHFSYHLSKRILHDLTRIMSVELAPAVRVNAVAPGIILPDREDEPEVLKKYREGNLLKKIGKVEEVTDAVVFLLKNDFITGQVIFVDGGRHIRGRFYGS